MEKGPLNGKSDHTFYGALWVLTSAYLEYVLFQKVD